RGRLIAAEAALATGDAPAAARHAEAAMAADPLDEAAHRRYMSAAAAAGEQAQALPPYAALSGRPGEHLGHGPPPQTPELHLAILREQPVVPEDGVGRGPAPWSPRAAHAGSAGADRAVAAVSGAGRTAVPVPRMGRTAAGVPGLGRQSAIGPALAGRGAE